MATPRPLNEAQARRHGLAAAALQRGALDEALAGARQLVAEAPDAPDALQILGLVHSERGEHDEALRCLHGAVALSPAQPMLLANLGTLLRRAGRIGDAVDAFQRAAEADPGNAARWRQCGAAALDAGEVEAALAASRQAVALAPGDAANWRTLGVALREAGRWQRAAAALLRALAIETDDAGTWLNLGAVTRMLGRPERALECFERARSLGYAGRDLEHGIVGALVDLGRIDEALDRSRRLATAHPAWPEAHRTLALLRWEHGAPDDEDPFADYRRQVAARPDDRVLQWDYARLLIEAHRADEALPLLEALLPGEPGPMIRVLLGNAHESRGDSEAARPWYEAAMALYGDEPPTEVLNTWCRHLLKTGRWREAEAAAARACAQSPHDQESWAYRASAWRLLGDARADWLCDVERLVGFMPVEWPEGSDAAARLAALRAAVEPMHLAHRQPVQQSVRGGSQTPGRLFGRADPAIEAAAAALKATVERWTRGLPDDPSHPFLSRRHGVPEFTGSWSVKLWRAGRHANHMHSEGWLSSAFYLALPPSVAAGTAGDAGCLQFGSPPDELGLDLPPLRVVRPREGWLAVFPSYLWHGTMPFDDTEPRITAAFDLVMQPAA